MLPLTIAQRAALYNRAYPQHCPLAVGHLASRPFVHGYWFTGGGKNNTNVSSFWGSYQTEYLDRMNAIFPDCKGLKETVHLFSGSLPASADYTRVGKDFTGQYKSDFECDAHQLSSFLPFKPALIYADPPYNEIEEATEQYGCGKINRPRVLEECGLVLRPGGWLVWMDTALPTFSNNLLRLVGGITYIRSTGNHFRVVSIFQKPL